MLADRSDVKTGKPWQSRILALLLVTVTMGAVLIFACGGLGKLASSYLPATWYFALIEWKNGDSQATEPLTRLDG